MTASKVLILGANGRFGAAAATAFADAGWRVLAQVRRVATACHPRITPLAIALGDSAELAAAARGASVVVHAINPPYTRWSHELLSLGRLGMDLAQRLGAGFMLPGNVYNFGRAMPARLAEDTPQCLGADNTRKGRLRAELEAEMAQRAVQGLRSVVIRAGDFYGCGAGGWFDLVIAKSLDAGKLVYPGPLDVPHAWAYVPDLARAFVAVAARGVPTGHTNLHFAGHTLTGAQLLAQTEQAAAAIGAAPSRGWRRGGLPWALIRAGGLVVPMWRELAEMRYLWSRPHALDGTRLRALAGELPATPLAQSLASSLRALGFGQDRVVGAASISSTIV
jgi:nucleoside-diphosphate-sugar epimerase